MTTKFVHLLRDPTRTKLRQLSLYCRCGFSTAPVLIGFIAEEDDRYRREKWRIAWWNAETQSLVLEIFEVPLPEVLANRGLVWLGSELLPQLQAAHGACFSFVAHGKWYTKIPCPKCAKRNLLALSLKS